MTRAKAWIQKLDPSIGLLTSELARMLPQSIIGDDDRSIEIDTFGLPQRLIASLKIYARSGEIFYGTGWIAGPRVIISCGHCVFAQQLGGFAERIEIVPGLSGTKRPFGTFQSTQFEAHPIWKAGADRAYDIGCIFLPHAVGDALGHFAIGQAQPATAIVGQRLRCTGYPLFDGKHALQLSGEGIARGMAGSRLFHDVDTENGTSGGPVWLAGDLASPPTAIAVHSYEKEALPDRPGEFANSATLISPEILATVRGWLSSMI